jgi:pyrroline-5-carboxylate reductase
MKMAGTTNIAILGHGTLGRALAQGLRRDPQVGEIHTTTRSGGESNVEAVRASDVVILCLKPGQMQGVVQEIAPALEPRHIVISVAAAVSTASLAQWSGQRCPVVRVMPNTPVRTFEGMSVIARSPHSDERSLQAAAALFGTLGRVTLLDESLFDAATAISGCGPAYVFLIIEALRDAGVRLGLPRDTALLLSAQTLLGAAKMVLEASDHPAALKDEVTTPAGCTIDALLVLEDGKLRSTIMRAAIAAAERSATLAG